MSAYDSIARRKFHRSRDHAVIAGVCGGLAKYLGLDPMWVRIGYVLVSIFTAAFPGMLVYIVMMFVVPRDDAV